MTTEIAAKREFTVHDLFASIGMASRSARLGAETEYRKRLGLADEVAESGDTEIRAKYDGQFVPFLEEKRGEGLPKQTKRYGLRAVQRALTGNTEGMEADLDYLLGVERERKSSPRRISAIRKAGDALTAAHKVVFDPAYRAEVIDNFVGKLGYKR